MVKEILLHCADPDTEWWYDPDDDQLTTYSPLNEFLSFDHPWFEHHERGLNRTVHLNRSPMGNY